MFHPTRVLCLLACVAGWSVPAAGQSVWRCPDNSYSQRPCPGGTPVATDDARDAAQRAQTREAVRRDAKLADEMEKARLKEEAKPASVAIPPAKAQATDDRGDRTRSGAIARKTADFTAVAPAKPGEAKARKKPKKKPAKAA